MTQFEKKERIKYLWFRVRVISVANIFVKLLGKFASKEQDFSKFSLEMHCDDISLLSKVEINKKKPMELF